MPTAQSAEVLYFDSGFISASLEIATLFWYDAVSRSTWSGEGALGWLSLEFYLALSPSLLASAGIPSVPGFHLGCLMPQLVMGTLGCSMSHLSSSELPCPHLPPLICEVGAWESRKNVWLGAQDSFVMVSSKLILSLFPCNKRGHEDIQMWDTLGFNCQGSAQRQHCGARGLGTWNGLLNSCCSIAFLPFRAFS